MQPSSGKDIVFGGGVSSVFKTSTTTTTASMFAFVGSPNMSTPRPAVFGEPVFGSAVQRNLPSSTTPIIFNTSSSSNIFNNQMSSGLGVFGQSGNLQNNIPATSNSFAATGSTFALNGPTIFLKHGSSTSTLFGTSTTITNVFSKTSNILTSATASLTTSTNMFGAKSFNFSSTATRRQVPTGTIDSISIQSSSQNVFGASTNSKSLDGSGSQSLFPNVTTSTRNSFGVFGGTSSAIFGTVAATKSHVFESTVTKTTESGKNIFGTSNNQAEKRMHSRKIIGGRTLQDIRRHCISNSERNSQSLQADARQSILQGKTLIKKSSLSSRNLDDSVKIEVTNMPERFNNVAFLHQHFSKFGKIKGIAPTPSLGSATLSFDTREEAKNAKENGCLLEAGMQPLSINLKTGNIQRTRISNTAAPAIKRSQMFKNRDDIRAINSFDSLASVSDIKMPALEYKQDDSIGNTSSNKDTFLNYDINVREKNKKNDGDVDDVDDSAAGGDDGNGAAEALKQKHLEKLSSTYTPPRQLDSTTWKNLASTKANSSDDRFKVLEQRDKFLRNATQKNANLSTSKALKGTCPDMCPEKERYMREDRRRLSNFEMVLGTDFGQNPTVDHSRAIKEYSRSSADQEMPLPSELRPPHVLNMTMNYLLANIMDRGGPGLWSEWYDFLWNRMRSIRKDITQQMLCDVTSVELVEKSTRFHILCSELLCEEEPGVFDQKINSENLTKCLQTLKELYHDLYVKHGVVCPHESEFRSYMILMNINSAGDILREAQQWHQEVRQSETFKRSMTVYTSVSSNNYIKFFKLVKHASYLDSCILHRYFNQVRSVAVSRIAKAFNSPASTHVISYPYQELINHLGFESNMEASTFLCYFGLSVVNDQIVTDNKQSRLAETESTTMTVKRSKRLVGSKASVSLGEVVNGAPLPGFIPHTPHGSFDNQGYLLLNDIELPIDSNTSIYDLDLLKHQQVSNNYNQDIERDTAYNSIPRNSSPLVHKNNLVNIHESSHNIEADKRVKEIVIELISEVTKSVSQDISEDVIEDSHRFLLLGAIYGEALFKEFVDMCVRDCCLETVNEFKKDKQEREDLMHEAANQESTQLLNGVVISEVDKLCSDVLQSAWLAETEVRKESATTALVEEILSEVTNEESTVYCNLYHGSKVRDVLHNLDDFRADVKRKLSKKYWDFWNAHMREKRANRLFPSTVNLHQNFAEIFDEMFPRNSIKDSYEATSNDFLPLDGEFGISLLSLDDIVTRQNEIKARLEREESELIERKKFCWSALDLFRLVEERLCHNLSGGSLVNTGSKLFWKLVISVPEDGLIFTYKRNLFLRWLKRKFRMNEDTTDFDNDKDLCYVYSKSVLTSSNESPSTHQLNNTKARLNGSSYISLNISVRSIIDADIKSKIVPREVTREGLFGASAILFFIRDWCNSEDDGALEIESHRLFTLLSSKPSQPVLPLVVMGSSGNRKWSTPYLVEKLNLNDMMAQNIISSFQIVMDGNMDVNDPQTTCLLESSVNWLIEKRPPNLSIETKAVIEFFEENVARFFLRPVLKNLKQRKENHLLDLPINKLVDCYNSVVNWLINIVSHPSLSSTSWPPSECCVKSKDLPSPHWNTEKRLNGLQKFLSQLILLPKFSESVDWENEVMGVLTLDEASLFVKEYTHIVSQHTSFPSKLVTKINNLIEKTKIEFGTQKCRGSRVKKQSHLPSEMLPNTSIVMACIDFQLSQLACVEDLYDRRTLFTTYFPKMLTEENSPPLNLQSLLERKSPARKACKRKYSCGVCNKCSESETVTKCDTLQDSYHFYQLKSNMSYVDLDDHIETYHNEISDTSDLALDSLFDLLNSEKEASKSFEEYLKKVLQEGNAQPESPKSTNCSFHDEGPKKSKLISEDCVQISRTFNRGQSLSPLNPTQKQSFDHLLPTFNPVTSAGIKKDLDILNFKIEQEKKANALYELKLKTMITNNM